MSFVKTNITFTQDKKLFSNCEYNFDSKSLHIFSPSDKQLFNKKKLL